jgi:hypothetical protein
MPKSMIFTTESSAAARSARQRQLRGVCAGRGGAQELTREEKEVVGLEVAVRDLTDHGVKGRSTGR